MRDIKLDEKTWDIFVSDSGDQVLIDGIEAYIQRLKIKLMHIRGEWFEDTTTGTLGSEIFGKKNPDTEAIGVYIKKVIQEDQETKQVLSVDVSYSPRTREAEIKFSAETTHGAAVVEGIKL